MPQFDVVVVGSGSSGGVLASRLSEDPDCRVLLLEAGRDFPDEATRMPGFYFLGAATVANGLGSGAPTPEYDWGYLSEAFANGRRSQLRRGKMVGGTSMINGCIAVRGRPGDFEQWVRAGAVGWGWDDVRPYYERVESTIPLRSHSRETWSRFVDIVLSGYQEIGYAWADDLNDPASWGRVVGATLQNRRNSVRLGTLPTYIRAARNRANFTIRSCALVERVVVAGSRATAVEYLTDDGQRHSVPAGVVVLSAGAYGSPQILLRSGIGPASDIAGYGINPIADLPVGEHMFDHPVCTFTLSTQVELAGLYGPHRCALVRGDDWFAMPYPMDEEIGVCGISFILASDHGRGTLRLSSRDPASAPVIDHRHDDIIADSLFDDAWASYRQLLNTGIFKRYGISDITGSNDLQVILSERVESAQHPVGGCNIGEVVDPSLSVLGFESLFVADSSVFPRHVSNNPNLTCFMIGERAADIIKSRWA
jgi:choline dehydrogenase